MASWPRSLTALQPRSLASSHPRSLAAHSLEASQPRSLAASQPCGLAALRPHRLPRVLQTRRHAASRPPSRIGSLAASRTPSGPLSIALEPASWQNHSSGQLLASRGEVRRGNSPVKQVSRDTECDKNTRIEVLKRHAAEQEVHIAAKPHRGACGRNVPSSEEEEEEKSIPRERISSRAIQLYMATQLRSSAALRPWAALVPCGSRRLRGPRRRYGLRALGMF